MLSDYRLPKNVHGFKCWYCDARLIEDGAKLAFIGVNPTGDQHDAAHDKKERMSPSLPATRITGTAESEPVRFPNRSPSGANEAPS